MKSLFALFFLREIFALFICDCIMHWYIYSVIGRHHFGGFFLPPTEYTTPSRHNCCVAATVTMYIQISGQGVILI
jgi:hypothetical protein